jgi:hypothetical protein
MLLVRISAFFAEVGSNIKYQYLILKRTPPYFLFCQQGDMILHIYRNMCTWRLAKSHCYCESHEVWLLSHLPSRGRGLMVRAICIKMLRLKVLCTCIEFIRAIQCAGIGQISLNEFISEIVGGSALFLLLWSRLWKSEAPKGVKQLS